MLSRLLVVTLSASLLAAAQATGYKKRRFPRKKPVDPKCNLGEVTKLIDCAGLTSAAFAPGNTIFAPDDSAFMGFDANELCGPKKELLKSILTYHVVPEFLPKDKIPRGKTYLPTVNGAKVTVRRRGYNSIRVNNAQVIVPDIIKKDGYVVHCIDKVLIPPQPRPTKPTMKPAKPTMKPTGPKCDLGIVTDLIECAELKGEVFKAGNTIFGPDNKAFKDFPPIEKLCGEKRDMLISILTYHVVPKFLPKDQIPQGKTYLPTLNGAKVSVYRDGNYIKVNNDAKVIAPDFIEKDGYVVHCIDEVLTPPQPPAKPTKPTKPHKPTKH